MTDKPVGWAFIGTTGWVSSRFAPTVRTAGHRVVGAFGSSPAGSAAFAEGFGGTAYQSLDQMLADPAVEAVWVASPTDLHPDHARAAAAAGRPVLVEKPIAADAAAARRLAADLAGAAGPVGVGFQLRFNPAVAAVAAALADGRLGTLSSLLVSRGIAGPAEPTRWRRDAARSGGWSVTDIGTHLIDAVRFLLGEVDFAAARLSSPGRGLAVDDLSVLVLTRGAATAVVRASTGAAGPEPYIEASGTDGWVRVDDFWAGGGRLTDSTGRDEAIVPADSYLEQVKAFSAAVRGAAWTGATLHDGVRVAELTEAARDFSVGLGG